MPSGYRKRIRFGTVTTNTTVDGALKMRGHSHPFARNTDGTRVRTYAPTRWLLRDSLDRVRERETEVVLEVELGVRPERVGYWGIVKGRTRHAHFWLEVPAESKMNWRPSGTVSADTFARVRRESACGRWDLDRYLSGPDEVAKVDVSKHNRFCARCAFAVEAEGA